MNGPMIQKVSLYCIYGTYLRSVPRLNATIKRFESDNADNKGKQTLKKDHSKLKTQDSPHDKRRMFNLLSDNIFRDMAANDKRLSKAKSEESKGDHKIKLKKIVNSFSKDDGSDNIKKIEVAKPIKKQEPLKPTDNEKKNFLTMAKKVALELKIDVTKTQEDLLSHYNEITDLTDYSENIPKLVEENVEDDDHEDESMPFDMESSVESLGNLSIFKEEPFGRERKGEGEGTDALDEVGLRETGAFMKDGKEVEEAKLETWESLKKIELDELHYKPPSNYFEELILWTELGKLHRFPIDNEQDWHEEHGVDFTEHIFLEKHLEPWCPKTGPLRHFMELITTGLSKNPYLSVQKKKDHLMWYRDYFFEKSSLLKEVGIHLNTGEEGTRNEKAVQK